MSDDKVIHAFPSTEPPENLLAIEPRPAGVPSFCDHEAVRLNQHDRVVNCARCGATLDSFDFLVGYGKTIEMAFRRRREVLNMVAELNDSVAVLTKTKKRLQEQVKRLQEKVGGVVNFRAGESGQ